jgi:hypothetical protein
MIIMEILDEQLRNRRTHTFSLSLTKLGDGLVDPKLVLSWLLTYLGAGAVWVGMLVPLREAGALLPQLFTAVRLRRFAVRKWWWVIGSMVQGLAVLGMAVSALTLEGDIAGLAIVILVGVFALARSICSVSYKDVLGKTVNKEVRGLVTGTASSLAAGGVLIFGLALWFGWINEPTLIIGALGLAGILWLIAALQFINLREPESEVVTLSKNQAVSLYVNYLINDQELRKFIYTRALLTSTAIAPPFLILLAQTESGSIVSQLGALVIAASFSTFISGRVWGKLSDQSTKAVLSIAGLAGGTVLLIAIIFAQFDLFNTFWFLPLILFVLMTSYQGVRIARSIHLVNLATEDTRAAYTALSNTIIGVVLLGTGLFGVLAELVGITSVVIVLAIMSLLGGLMASRLINP